MSNLRAVAVETRLGGIAGLWYLATPYARYPFGVNAAAEAAAKISAALLNEGVMIFSPIAHGHAINQHGGPGPGHHDVWLPLDELVMAACQGCIVARMPGYHYSKGVRHEIEWFTKAGLPVLYLDVVELLGLPNIFNDHTLAHEAAAALLGEEQPAAYDVQRSSLNPPGTSTDQAKRLFAGYGPTESEIMDKQQGDEKWQDRQKAQMAELDAAHAKAQPVPEGEDADGYRKHKADAFAELRPTTIGIDYAQPGSDHTVEWIGGIGGPVPWLGDGIEVAQLSPDERESHAYRKARPVTTGVLDYFPDAIAEIARISKLGHEQHKALASVPELHWERTFNDDHADSLARHLADRGGFGHDGARHSANMAWRALALLQTELEDEMLAKGVHPILALSRASRIGGKTLDRYFVFEGSGCETREEWLQRGAEFWGPAPGPSAVESELCQDEGCDHYGTPHVCINKSDPQFKAGYVAGLRDGHAEQGDSTCEADTAAYHAQQARTSDGHMFREASRAQFTDAENLAFDLELSDFLHGRRPDLPLWTAAKPTFTDEELRNRIAKLQQNVRTSIMPEADQPITYKHGFGPGDGDMAVADEPTDTAESVQSHAARSLADMVREYLGVPAANPANPDGLYRVILGRLKRFWHD